jgi:uncharacterized protein
MTTKDLLTLLLGIVGVMFVSFLAAFALPWDKVTWGKVQFGSDNTVTVTGNADSQIKNDVASFTAGIDAVNDSKEAAIAEANDIAAKIIQAAKNFGIPESDIKTQNMSIYQTDETYIEDGVTKSRKGQWRVGNTVEVVLRDATKTSDLSVALSAAGANNLFGPNYRVDEEADQTGIDLMGLAMEDARNKAEAIAKASGKSVGEVVNVVEGNMSGVMPFYAKMDGMGGGGMPSEPGTSTVSKSLTVTFELR